MTQRIFSERSLDDDKFHNSGWEPILFCQNPLQPTSSLSRFGRPFHSFPMLEVKSAVKFRERMIILLLADQCCNAGWVLLMSYASQVVQAFSRQQYHGSELRVLFPLSCWFPIATCWIYMAPEISPTTWICNPAPGAGLSGSHSQGLGRSTTLSNWLMNPQVEGELGFGQGFVRGGWSCFFWLLEVSQVQCFIKNFNLHRM